MLKTQASSGIEMFGKERENDAVSGQVKPVARHLVCTEAEPCKFTAVRTILPLQSLAAISTAPQSIRSPSSGWGAGQRWHRRE
eukprot:1582587-Rhodomonas_salina.2